MGHSGRDPNGRGLLSRTLCKMRLLLFCGPCKIGPETLRCRLRRAPIASRSKLNAGAVRGSGKLTRGVDERETGSANFFARHLAARLRARRAISGNWKAASLVSVVCRVGQSPPLRRGIQTARDVRWVCRMRRRLAPPAPEAATRPRPRAAASSEARWERAHPRARLPADRNLGLLLASKRKGAHARSGLDELGTSSTASFGCSKLPTACPSECTRIDVM